MPVSDCPPPSLGAVTEARQDLWRLWTCDFCPCFRSSLACTSVNSRSSRIPEFFWCSSRRLVTLVGPHPSSMPDRELFHITLLFRDVISRCYFEDLNLQLLDFKSELYPKLGTTLKVVSTSVRYELRHQNRNDGAKGSGMPG